MMQSPGARLRGRDIGVEANPFVLHHRGTTTPPDPFPFPGGPATIGRGNGLGLRSVHRVTVRGRAAAYRVWIRTARACIRCDAVCACVRVRVLGGLP